MAETPEEEIDDLVSSVPDESNDQSESDADTEASGAEEETPKKRRVRRTGRRKSKAKEPEPKTIEEAEVEELMPKGLPKPDSTGLKSLGDLYAKFGVGTYPEMKVHLYRTYPKIAPGGVKFDGFYDEYDMPILEQQIQAEYGGGQYRVVVVGPNPANPRLPKHYASHSISLAGEPDFNRMPRALRKPPKESDSGSGATNANPPPMMTQAENPKLVESALRMFEKQTEYEREERRRLEQKMEQERTSARTLSDPVAEAERRRADDLIKSERERSQTSERFYQQQVEDSRRVIEEMKRDMERVERSRPSVGAEIRELAEAGLLGNNRGSETAITEMFNRVVEKHREEISALNKSHSEFVSHLRQGHATELQALREAHAREISAEREASRSREERIEDRLKSEREERRRDEERHRKDVELRDQHWKDRMEQSLQSSQSNWESRHQSLTSTYENRVQWLQQEIDKLKQENYELRNKQEEKGDVMTQLLRYKELGSLVKEIGGNESTSSSSSASGGLGLSGGGQDDWKGMAVEAVMERAPTILEKLFGGGSPQANQQAAQQVAQQYKEGQVLDTPQGKMEVVKDPNTGQLALAPKELLDRHREQVKAAQGERGLLAPGGGSPRSQQRKKSRSAGVSAVPNLAEGLPRRRPPWEGGGDDDRQVHVPPPPPPPPPQPRMTTRTPEAPASSEPIELSQTERMALREIAKAVHKSVTQGDDPEEFVQHMLERYPAEVLTQVVGGYSDRQIVQGVVQLEPKSAGATPAGQQFMVAAFQLMRRALS